MSHHPAKPTEHTHNQGHDHHHQHGHGEPAHQHSSGLSGALREIFVTHSHDTADSVDNALETSTVGIRAVKISLVALGITALFQVIILIMSGSIALAADTIHNFSDALTAIPLWIAFALGRRAATKRYTYGYGRAEDLAGLFIVATIAASAIIAGYQAVLRIVHPMAINNLGWVAAAGVVGFLVTNWSPSTGFGSAAKSAQPHSSPTVFTPAPTDSPRWQWFSAPPGSRSASRWRILSSGC